MGDSCCGSGALAGLHTAHIESLGHRSRFAAALCTHARARACIQENKRGIAISAATTQGNCVNRESHGRYRTLILTDVLRDLRRNVSIFFSTRFSQTWTPRGKDRDGGATGRRRRHTWITRLGHDSHDLRCTSVRHSLPDKKCRKFDIFRKRLWKDKSVLQLRHENGDSIQKVRWNFPSIMHVGTILGAAKLNTAMLRACPIALFLSRYSSNQTITQMYARCTENHVAFVRM